MSKLVTLAAMYGETENGALTYVTSGSKVLDLFAQGGALRSRSEDDIIRLVEAAYKENPKQTVEALLYIRDVRGGQGEKRTFRVAMRYLHDNHSEDFRLGSSVFDAIVEVGSWKDIFTMFTVEEYATYVKEHWNDENSLMFKWLPSVGGSSNKEAEKLASALGLTPKQYRKYLSKKRAELRLVETSMCKNKWEEVNYEHVPSRANLIYRNAFAKHDKDRYKAYIEAASQADGTVNMNTGTLYPYEIIEKYVNAVEDEGFWKVQPSLEAMWKNLPNYCDDSNSLVVADTSGSMQGRPMAVATSLAVYFSERNRGIFANEFVTFSRCPLFYYFTKEISLMEKIKTMQQMNICENTNIQAVFELLLKTAITNKLPESEMPKNIYIISDMEFDEAQGYTGVFSKTNYEAIQEKYSLAGYSMPKIIFWNVDSRNDNLPVKMDDSGVALVSGCSPSTFKMTISGDVNPYNFMLKTIEIPRYAERAAAILKA